MNISLEFEILKVLQDLPRKEEAHTFTNKQISYRESNIIGLRDACRAVWSPVELTLEREYTYYILGKKKICILVGNYRDKYTLHFTKRYT